MLRVCKLHMKVHTLNVLVAIISDLLMLSLGLAVLVNCFIIFNVLSKFSSSFIISKHCIVRYSTLFSVCRNEFN